MLPTLLLTLALPAPATDTDGNFLRNGRLEWARLDAGVREAVTDRVVEELAKLG